MASYLSFPEMFKFDAQQIPETKEKEGKKKKKNITWNCYDKGCFQRKKVSRTEKNSDRSHIRNYKCMTN